MANILLVTADTAHVSCTRSAAAFQSRGHAITAVSDSNGAGTLLDAAWAGGSYDMIASVRHTASTTFSSAQGWMRDKWAAGVPLLIGGVEAGAGSANWTYHFAKALGLGSTFYQNAGATNVGVVAGYQIRLVTAHPITEGYTLGDRATVTGGAQGVVTAQTLPSGTELGYISSDGTNNNGSYMSAYSTGQALSTGASNLMGLSTAPARAAWIGWLYADSYDYAPAGVDLLDATASWLSPPPPGPAANWWDGAALAPVAPGWWDGAAVQPAQTLGRWDGAAIVPLA